MTLYPLQDRVVVKLVEAEETTKGGIILTAAAKEKPQVAEVVAVGPGIPEDEIPLVKKKFYKGSSSVRGTGIGLAVCDEIVEMHGGELILENVPGGGTLVTVKLPVAQ